jgi:hypothetical protein
MGATKDCLLEELDNEVEEEVEIYDLDEPLFPEDVEALFLDDCEDVED